jgi:hypothetical protein
MENPFGRSETATPSIERHNFIRYGKWLGALAAIVFLLQDVPADITTIQSGHNVSIGDNPVQVIDIPVAIFFGIVVPDGQ